MESIPSNDSAPVFNLGAYTVDGFDNFVSRVGLNNDNTLSAGYYTFNLLTRNRVQLEAAYRGSWVAGVIVDAVSDDMTRAGIDITTNEQDADIKDLQTKISRLQIWNSFRAAIKWSRLYGGSIAIIQIRGQDLSTPLDVKTVSKDSFDGLVVYDRWQLNPTLTQVIQSGPEMGLPKYYNIVNNPAQVGQSSPENRSGQITVHHSRCIRLTGIDLPYFQALTEMMWGESLLERLWDRMIAFDNSTMSVANLIERANNRTVGVENLREILSIGGKAQQGLEAMFAMMRTFQTNEGLTLLDKNDTHETTSYTFAGIAETMLQFGQQLAGASGIPLVRLFGQSPAGLSATGESDIRMYYDSINSQQESKLRRGWDVLLKILWRSTYGKDAPKDLEFSFTPLWQMSLIDKATIAKTNAETIIGAHEQGLVSTETAMKELRQSSGDTGIFSNITDEDIVEAEAEEPPLPSMGDPKPDDTEKKDVVPNIDAKPGILERLGLVRR